MERLVVKILQKERGEDNWSRMAGIINLQREEEGKGKAIKRILRNTEKKKVVYMKLEHIPMKFVKSDP
jgi:hypothetical protein